VPCVRGGGGEAAGLQCFITACEVRVQWPMEAGAPAGTPGDRTHTGAQWHTLASSLYLPRRGSNAYCLRFISASVTYLGTGPPQATTAARAPRTQRPQPQGSAAGQRQKAAHEQAPAVPTGAAAPAIPPGAAAAAIPTGAAAERSLTARGQERLRPSPTLAACGPSVEARWTGRSRQRAHRQRAGARHRG
jgi:hypothetical protein